MRNRKYLLPLLLTLWIPSMGQELVDYPLPCRVHQAPGKLYTDGMTRAAASDKFVIPVVFHVFGTDFNGKAVTREIVRDALRRTNEDYNCLTKGSMPSGDDDPLFNRLSTPLNIEFRLAEKGPQGEATTGIVFHRLESGFGNYNAPHLSQYAWNNRSYMNVYIMNDLYGDGVTNNSGVSWYPYWEMTRWNLARVVYNGAYLGDNTDENFRRVLTHEFGHFLNLAHTFDYDPDVFPDGCRKGNNGQENPNDYVDDTPPADRPQMGPDDLNCLNQKTNWTNYMNYSYVRTSMFTKGQVDRMTAALQDRSRACLWNDKNLQKVFFSDESISRIVLDSKAELFPYDADGHYDADFRFSIINGSAKEGGLTPNTDFVIANLPEGLTATAIGNKDHVRLNIKGRAQLSEDRKITVTFKPSATAASNFYEGTQPLTIAHDYDATETGIRTVADPHAKAVVSLAADGTLKVTAPCGSRITVYNAYGEALQIFRLADHSMSTSLAGYGHGMYIVSVLTEKSGQETVKVKW